MKKAFKILSLILVLVMMTSCTSACPKTSENEKPGEKPGEEKVYTLSGAENTAILAGKTFNPLKGVRLKDEAGTDCTQLLQVKGNVDYGVAGDYKLTYFADGKKAGERTVTVTHNPKIAEDENKRPETYVKGDGSDYNIAAFCKAFSSADANQNSGASFAFDNNGSTRWESPHGAGEQYLTVDLGEQLTFSGISIDWEAAYALSYEISVSDNNRQFSKIYEINDIPKNKPAHTDDIQLTANARYVKLLCKERASAYGYSVFEFIVRGKEGTVAPSEDYPQLAMIDKTKQTVRVSLDLGENFERYAFSKIWISGQDWRNAGDFTLTTEISSDNVNFYTFSDGKKSEHLLKDSPDKTGMRVFALSGEAEFLNVAARFVRITFFDRPLSAKAYEIAEINFQRQFKTEQGGYLYGAPDNVGGGYIKDANLRLEGAVASSEANSEGAGLAFDGNTSTCWTSDSAVNEDQIIRLFDGVKEVGELELTFQENYGKYYDLYISQDGQNYTLAFRQHHGGEKVQTVSLYKSLQYIKIVDYSNHDTARYRLVRVAAGSPYPGKTGQDYTDEIKKEFFSQYKRDLGAGSYAGGMADFHSARLINNLAEDLRGLPVPSNDWWQSLLINNLGHSMYLNPLRARFTASGLAIGYPGEGYIEGLSQKVTEDNDLIVFSENIDVSKMRAVVTGYSDFGVEATLTDSSGLDKMTVNLNQGSPYAYFTFLNKESPSVKFTGSVNYFNESGETVLNTIGSTYTGDMLGVTVKTLSKLKRGGDDERVYEYRSYVLNVPDQTDFTLSENRIFIKMTEGNYLSVGALPSTYESFRAPELSQIQLMHKRGYAFVKETLSSYEVGEDNVVKTVLTYRTVAVKGGDTETVVSAMPHQWAKSKAEFLPGGYASVHGLMKLREDNAIVTEDKFYGIVPQFAEPDNEEYSRKKMRQYLDIIYRSEAVKSKSQLMSGDPYWQGKNLHPLAIGALIADQTGDIAYRDAFVDCIKYILADWYTYSGTGDEYYFYFDDEWKSLYYKNSEFGANFNMADHHFTYGYYLLATAVAAMYDEAFLSDYGGMAKLLIRDYMCYDKGDALMPYMRAFDPYAGHAWAGGYADNDGGNNQESAGEALNAWVGAYLFAQVTEDKELSDAAVYGFTTELNAIKEYWFDYNNRCFSEEFKDKYKAVGQIYGGSNFYGTFFNGEPLYIYGIHWIPGGEFLAHYAVGAREREIMGNLYDAAVKEQKKYTGKESWDAWYHIMHPIQAIADPDAAIAAVTGDNESLTLMKNGGSIENANAYWMINAFKTYGVKTDEIYAADCASAAVYKQDGGGFTAMAFNPTSKTKVFEFKRSDGTVCGRATVPAKSFYRVDPLSERTYGAYGEGEVKAKDYETLVGSFGSAYRAQYRLLLSEEGLYTFKAEHTGTLKIYLDGKLFDGANGARLYGRYSLTVEGEGNFEKIVFTRSPEERNIALGKSVVYYTGGSGGTGALTDGNFGNGLKIGSGMGGETFTLDLGAEYDLTKVILYFETARAERYVISVSDDGDNLTDIYLFEGPSSGLTDTLILERVYRARYIHFTCLQLSTMYPLTIFEFEAYAYV